MKKLMTVMASAATALFAHGVVADLTTTGTSVEGGAPGVNLNTAVMDVDGGADENVYWYMATTDGDNGVVYSNYVGETSASTPIATRPEKFKDDVNTTFLSLDTSSPLYRTALPNTQNPSGFSGATIGTDGIYLDTLVKFTAADDVFGEDALEKNVDKIAISYVEQGDDIEGALTNFVIRAGYIGSEVVATNYIAAVPAGFKKDDWHRLTVRTIANIDGAEKGHVGFVVYIDHVPLAYATGVVCGENFKSSGLAEEFYTDELHALYPSAVDTNYDNYNKIAAASFSGTGAIDDVVFTTTPPGFIDVDPDVTVKWDAHVATLKLNGSDVVGFVAGEAGQAKITPNEGVVTVVATFADGWEYGACATDGHGEWVAANKQFTGLSAGEICNIVSMKPLFDVGGVRYASITDEGLLAALAAGTQSAPATLKLLADVETPIEVTTGYIILDLAGKTITDAEDGEGKTAGFAISNAGANLTITNSTETIGHVVASANGAAVAIDGGLTTITAGIFDGVFDGQEEGNLVITGGTFYDDEYDGDTVTGFYLADYVSGATPAYIGEQYFQVGEGSEQPETFALTTTGGANATVTTDPDNVSALTEATQVTITATAAQDYTYDGVDLSGTDWTYDSTKDAISLTITVSADTAIAVPNAVAEQSSEDWPKGQDLIDAEGKAAEDLFPGITNALATADAKAVATWAEANNVEYAAKGSILPEAFLLNCANTQAAIDEAAANFKVTAITVVGDTVTITPADGADYGNGKVVIEGTATLSPISWHEKTDGDHFFRATLVVKPVTP